MLKDIRSRYIVVSANFLYGRRYWVYGTGQWMDPDQYSVLQDQRPVAILGHTLYVYDAMAIK